MIPILKKNEPWPEIFPEEGFVVLINKPEDWTSFDVVNKLRRHLKIKKVGHAGTLDPFATGLLIVGVGRGTKHMQQFAGLDKQYRACLHLGVETDTYDATGAVLAEQAVGQLTRSEIEQVLQTMLGPQMQVPPMYSAKKVNGTPLYKLARKGRTVERKAVEIVIHRVELKDWQPPLLWVEMDVSKGTYVRSFAHDLGKKLGVGAHLKELERTAIGPHRLSDAFEIEEFLQLWKTKQRQ